MLKISPIPAFNDNYIWAIEPPESDDLIIVDPGDASPVFTHIESSNKRLTSILITHHHFDHVGGVEKLKKATGATVYGPKNSPFTGSDLELYEGNQIEVSGLTFEVIEIPGHTLDHIAYYCSQHNLLFCGDTLFAGGCGRVFEGTHQQMFESLLKLKSMPGDTQVFCAHEYTLANLQFALAVEPQNQRLQERYQICSELRNSGQPTLPSAIDHENATNPFLRASNAEEFAERRLWKDNY